MKSRMMAERKALGKTAMVIVIIAIVVVAGLGTSALVLTNLSRQQTQTKAVVVDIFANSMAYTGCINPSVPVSVLRLDGTQLTLNSTLGYYETRLMTGTTHTLSADQTYSGQCPTGCPECSAVPQGVTVHFSYWLSALNLANRSSNPLEFTIPSNGTLSISAVYA